MIKKINAGGIQLDNYTVREGLMEMELSLQKKPFYIIEEVSSELLLMAYKNEMVKEVLESSNLTMMNDRSILEAFNIVNMQRKHEAEEYVFFQEFMRRVEKKQQSVFWLFDTTADIPLFMDFVKAQYPKIVTVGTTALEECVGATDAIINEINAATPAVIVSFLPSPTQEAFLAENRDKFLTNIWYGYGRQKNLIKRKKGIGAFLRRKTRTRTIKKYVKLRAKIREE